MRHFQSTLSGKDVCGWATHILLGVWRTLGGLGCGGVVSPLLLVQVLVRAAAERRSLDAIVGLARNLPSAETIRKAVLRLLPKATAELEPAIVDALHCRLPKALHRRPRTMVIDLHTKPYYGDKKTPGIYRSRRKASTKTFFAYATLLVVRKGLTFTVGLVPVVNREELTTIINKLLQQAAAKGLRPRRLLLDRGFYAAKVMLDLQRQNIPFVIPMLRRGKSGRTQQTCTGTAQFFVKGRSGWALYTWEARIRTRGRRGRRTPVTTEVCMLSEDAAAAPWVFACYGMRHLDPKEIGALYHRRFRIETSYRQMREGLALTCSKNAVYRLLLVLIALVLRNVWLWLHWTLLADRDEQGRRVLRLDRLRARTMLHWLVRYLDHRLKIAMEIVVPNPAATAT